ncbi:MAG: hypothetical protein GXP15_16900 [Gammaproteobacteria bacterium]|nr:hypothetical protein [Gammaproteobacteria bacterium]
MFLTTRQSLSTRDCLCARLSIHVAIGHGMLAALMLLAGFSSRDAVSDESDASSDESATAFNDWRIRGRLQIDGARYSGDNSLFIDDIQVRRARLAFAGKLMAGFSVKLEYELGDNTLKPKGMYLRKKLGENGRLTVGHFKLPVSLQTATSSLDNTFMERSLPNLGATGFRLGAMASTYGDSWSVSSGVTGGRLSDQYEISREGVGFFARGVFNPVRSGRRLWHLGLSSEFRRYGAGDSVRLRTRPESDVTGVRLVDTGRMRDLEQSFRYTAEVAWKRNSLQVQAEYMRLLATRLNGSSDLDFAGWYAQAGWFITGESRRYNRRRGRFRRTRPEHAYGAWEVAVRYSTIDLNSFDVLGGEETNRSIALNWYATDSLRFSLNYIDAVARRNAADPEENVSIIQARFQFAF